MLLQCQLQHEKSYINSDQMQLGQPVQGTHPEDSGLSVL